MISVAYAFVLAFALVLATVFIHYEVLRSTLVLVPAAGRRSTRSRMVLLLGGIMVAHVIEISLYGMVYYLLHDRYGLGTIAGATNGSYLDYFYFSAATYTTAGYGDLYPQGPVRILAGIEALNGFVLIGWSTSFTFLAMQRFTRAGRQSARAEADLD